MKRTFLAATMIAALLTGLSITQTRATAQAAAPAPTPAQDSPAKVVDLAGKWHFVLDTEGGDREIEADFAVDSNGKVTGTFGKAAVAGTYFNKKLDLAFDFTSDEVSTTAEMAIKGTLDEKGGLSGSWKFSEYDGTFKATRVE
jgi:hypothetical protein